MSFVKTTESYEVYWLGHRLGSSLEQTKMGLVTTYDQNYHIGPDCAGRA